MQSLVSLSLGWPQLKNFDHTNEKSTRCLLIRKKKKEKMNSRNNRHVFFSVCSKSLTLSIFPSPRGTSMMHASRYLRTSILVYASLRAPIIGSSSWNSLVHRQPFFLYPNCLLWSIRSSIRLYDFDLKNKKKMKMFLVFSKLQFYRPYRTLDYFDWNMKTVSQLWNAK